MLHDRGGIFLKMHRISAGGIFWPSIVGKLVTLPRIAQWNPFKERIFQIAFFFVANVYLVINDVSTTNF